jgi:glutamyl-tRNA reductase
MMTVLFVGMSHASAPLATVERAGFTGDDAAATLACITTGDRVHTLPLRELVILSTCHRVELYGVPADDVTRPSVALDAMSRLLADRVGSDTPVDAQLRRLVGTEATRHLFRVAAGLESIVVGESEVLAQVSAAHALSLRVGAAGPTLTPLFEAAVRAGRRARSETAIATVPASVSSIAAELAEELADELRGRRALLVGGGKIGRLAAKSLRARGFWDMSIVSPASEDGAALASDLGATEIQPDGLARAIAESDLVFTCAGSLPIDAQTVRQAMRGRMARPIAFIDLAAGDVVDPAIAELAGVRLVTPAELRERIDVAIAGRRREAPHVETIVEEELRVLQARTEGSSLSGVVAALRARAEEIRQRELARALAGLPDADAAVRAQLEWLSVSLVNKLLDEPTRRLRAEATQGPANPYADATRELFGLPAERADRPPA